MGSHGRRQRQGDGLAHRRRRLPALDRLRLGGVPLLARIQLNEGVTPVRQRMRRDQHARTRAALAEAARVSVEQVVPAAPLEQDWRLIARRR